MLTVKQPQAIRQKRDTHTFFHTARSQKKKRCTLIVFTPMNILSSFISLPVLFRILIGASILLLVLTQTVFTESLIIQDDSAAAGVPDGKC